MWQFEPDEVAEDEDEYEEVDDGEEDEVVEEEEEEEGVTTSIQTQNGVARSGSLNVSFFLNIPMKRHFVNQFLLV